MRAVSLWLLIVLLAAVSLGLSAGADSVSEAGFLVKINASRSASSLAPLSVDDGLQNHARVHTQDMIDAGNIYHSTSDELKAAGGSGWSKLGENVGRGGTVDSLHTAFMNSSGHKANILGDYNYAGIGTGTLEGVLYVTVDFMKKGDGSTTTTTVTPAITTTPKATVLPLIADLLLPTGAEAQPLCPVAAPVEFSNSYGYPRPGGRTHKGIDLFAVRGAPVVAPEAGTLTIGFTRLGGKSVWVQADSDNRYYMTHLDGWATNIVQDGQWVQVGWVVGYVGDSGNAYVPQLHVEVRVRGRNVNPYSWLNDSCRTPDVPPPYFHNPNIQ